ncbi:hypothetical protein HDU91_003056 [Kappamyces sp. JEL0680]|nr:hypothetical protein HDU91_003056 [Kappamyces sp. JEL0680]
MRSDGYVSPLTPTPVIKKEDFHLKSELEEMANLLVILCAFVYDITPNEKGLLQWEMSKNNPICLAEILVGICNMDPSRIDGGQDISYLFEAIQIRCIKLIWALQCIVRQGEAISANRLFQARIKSETLIQQPGLLRAAFLLITNWAELYIRNMESLRRNLPVAMSTPLWASVYRATLVLHMAYYANESGFRALFKEELDYVVKDLLHRIQYGTAEADHKSRCTSANAMAHLLERLEYEIFGNLAMVSGYCNGVRVH